MTGVQTCALPIYATSLGMYGEAEGKKLNKENDEKLINFIHSLLLAREQEARTKAIDEAIEAMPKWNDGYEDQWIASTAIAPKPSPHYKL